MNKCCVQCKSLKGLYFVASGLLEENATIFAIFHNRCSFYSTSYFFLSEKDPNALNIVSDKPRSLFNYTLVKMLSSDKRQSHTWFTFLLCLVITDSKLTENDLYLSILLRICTLN